MDEILRVAVINLRGMWAHRWLGLGIAWSVGIVGLGVVFGLPPKYEASARIFANTDSILKPLMVGLTVQPNLGDRIAMLSRVVISRPNVDQLVRKVGLDAEAKNPEDREWIIDRVMKTLEIKAVGRDNLYTLTFRDQSPQRAREAVDHLASIFIQSIKGGKVEDTEAAKKFIDEQIAVYDKKLQEAENRLKEFKLRNLGMTTSEAGGFFARVAETERMLNQSRLELREAERSRDAYSRRLADEAPGTVPGTPAPAAVVATIADLDARIEVQKRNLDGLQLKYTEDHPDVQGARRVILELEQQRRKLAATLPSRPQSEALPLSTGPRASETLKVSLAQAEAAVASLSTRVAEYQERHARLKASAELVPQLEAELTQLNRDYNIHKGNYESLVARRESANISGEMQSVAGVSTFRIVDPPRVSPEPVFPNLKLLMPLALAFSLAAGIAAAYAAKEVRPTFFDGRSLREATGLPILGVVSVTETGAERLDGRKGLVRFLGGAGALVGAYAGGFFVLRLLSDRIT